MSRTTAPAQADISTASRPGFDAATRELEFEFGPNMHHAPTAGTTHITRC
jgi:hypothetical protein